MNLTDPPAQLVIPPEFEQCLARQREAYLADPNPSHAQRVADLKSLARMLKENQDAILAAINRDYTNRSSFETLFAEFFVVLDGIRDTIKHVKGWMKPKKRHVDLMMYPLAQEPPDSAATGRGRRHRAVELPALPGLRAVDRHLRGRQPRDGQDVGELGPPGAAADLAQPEVLPGRQADVLRGRRRPRAGLRRAALRPPDVHRLGPDRPRGDGRRRAQPDAGDARTRRQGAGHRRRRLPDQDRRRARAVGEDVQRRAGLPQRRLPVPARRQGR